MMFPSHQLFRLAMGALLLAAAPVAADAADAVDTSIEQLQRAVTAQRDGSHMPLLFSLRQLRDPALQPLFQSLVQHDDWQVQVHAVLGLAELDVAGRIDPWQILQLAPEAQEAAIAGALDLNLLGDAQMNELLDHDDLPPLARLMLMAERIADNQTVAASDLEGLREHDDPRVAALALLLLAERGGSDALDRLDDMVNAMDARQRNAIMPWLLEAARQYDLAGASPWLRRQYAETETRTRRRLIVLTAVSVDPPANIDLWQTYLGSEPSYAQRVRAGLMLLASGERVPASAYDALGDDRSNELLRSMIEAGKAMSTGDNRPDAMQQLLTLGHGRVSEWVAAAVQELPDDEAARVYAFVLDQFDGENRDAAVHVDLAVAAAARLFEIDPDAVLRRVQNPAADETLVQVVLLGLFDAHSPRLAEAAASLVQDGYGRRASLSLLLHARHAASLTDSQRHHLGVIAGGGGHISRVLQVQAAWLYLKHSDSLEQALARIATE